MEDTKKEQPIYTNSEAAPEAHQVASVKYSRRSPLKHARDYASYSFALTMLLAGAAGGVLGVGAVALMHPEEATRSQLEAVVANVVKLESRVEALENAPKPVSTPATEAAKAAPVAPKPEVKAVAKAQPKKAAEAAPKTGKYKITFYCPCSKCCGKSDGITASGTKATAKRTVAAPKSFAFGTQIHIEGLGSYVVEDRGGSIKGNRLDVFVDSHEEALRLGVQYKDVEVARD